MSVVRVHGIVLEPRKHVKIAIRSIYGIGPKRASLICEKLDLKPFVKINELTDDQAKLLNDAVTEFKVEGDLRREVAMHIKRLRDIGSYRGLRHKRSLPVRGQRTRTNARTRKGPTGNKMAKAKDAKASSTSKSKVKVKSKSK